MAQSGNGIDIGTIYRLLTQMSARLDQVLAVVNDHSRILAEHSRQLEELRGQMGDVRAEMADFRTQMAEMRQEVAHYHGAVTSQGIHYSGLEDRVRRVERHLKLEPGQ
ncbi:MAG TPA: hypothetical protein VG651_11195 [Stellaceae bacterium]|nr:hypothetical protein [Stellaceae bacterium]